MRRPPLASGADLLVTVVLPFCDFRSLQAVPVNRLARPRWPDPTFGYLRGIGAVRMRLLKGFESWIGENSLVCGVPGLRLNLPRRLSTGAEVSLVRKACYFDGLVNGRFEFLFRIRPEPRDFAQVGATAGALLERPVRLAGVKNEGRPLGRQGQASGRLWATATVKAGTDPASGHVRSGRAFVVAETDTALEAVAAGRPLGIRLCIEGTGRPFELFTLFPPPGAPTGRGSSYRSAARLVRTYLVRMLQDVEALSQICAMPAADLDDERVQEVFNEYTRHVRRLRDKVEGTTDLVAYCYAAFARLYPGRIDGLRRELLASAMRPNIRRKLLQMLDDVEQAQVYIEQNFTIERVDHMGAKYDVDVSNSQGVAVGPSATATVTGSVNQSGDPALVAALRDLALQVRGAANDDAEIEAELIDKAASKAENGDEKGAVALLKKVGSWALGIAGTAGSAALTGFLKAHGIG